MDSDLDEFLKKAKEKGLTQDDIKAKLRQSGWDDEDINRALDPDELIAPPPPNSDKSTQPESNITTKPIPSTNSDRPIAVVQNLSVRGFEYAIMFITLLASAFAIGTLAHKFIYNTFDMASENYSYGQSDQLSAFMTTALIVCFPIFAYMFIRLKKAEIADPSLRKDPSRRKWVQFTELISFLFGLGYIIGFLYTTINPDSGESSTLQYFFHMLVTVVIAGGIFVYLWRDDHKKD